MRAIDADALQKEYMHEHDGKRLMLIDVAPTIEPQRKRGKWIEQEDSGTEEVCFGDIMRAYYEMRNAPTIVESEDSE